MTLYKKYLVKESMDCITDTIKITELPIGTWTEPYKAF